MKKYFKIKDIDVEIVKRRNQKNIYVKLSDDGEVKISSPLFVSDDYIQDFLNNRYEDIKKLQENRNIKNNAQKCYENGDEIYIFGEKYNLIVRRNRYQSVVTLGDSVILNVKNIDDVVKKEELMNKFYKEKLYEKILEISHIYEQKMNLKANEYRVKNMKTRWGTCNINKKRIWINLQLVQKDMRCLEYILVHELAHLIEKNHNKKFYAIVEKYCSDYKEIQKLLNSN